MSPGTILQQRTCPYTHALCSGPIGSNQHQYLLTVAHLFDAHAPGRCCIDNRVLRVPEHQQVQPPPAAHIIHQVEEIENYHYDYGTITADIALLEVEASDLPTNNRVTMPGSPDEFQLKLFKAKILRNRPIMMKNQHGNIVRGRIKNPQFTDKDENLFNVIAVVSNDFIEPHAIHEHGDSGALVFQHQGQFPEVSVFGLVTGIWQDVNTDEHARICTQTMTIVNRLWDVLRYSDQLANVDNQVEFV